MTPLLSAAREGAIDTAKVLLDAGVAVDQAKMRCRSSNAIAT